MPVIAAVPNSKPSRSSANLHLDFGNNIVLGLKLYTSVDEPKSPLHKGCPFCFNQVKCPNICSNEACESFDKPLDSTVKIYFDAAGEPIQISEEELDALLMPDGQALPDKKKMLLHTRLNEKEAYSMLSRATKKYYLVPDSGVSASIYAITLHTMLMTKQALMVKFCLTSQRQNLGLIVEDNNQLVLCMIPYASAFKPEPLIKLPTAMEASFVKAVADAFEAVPKRPYEEAEDNHAIAFDYLLQQKAEKAASTRAKTSPAPKKEKLVELTLSRPALKATKPRAPKVRDISLAPAKTEVPF